ncbi:Catenin-beta-like protein [Lophiotrema nucula]|uniref:Catenin-beta-like protein n=1 Tax=Lophiotrema nucula TaxID=690887 RepID=A0A6A5Z8J8_9PLEO|nr:Catenin-beta-like protein [Lophiotrema nucula]
MTSIDDIFKRPTSSKRKFENPAELDPTQTYKSVKLDSGSDAKPSAQASVADEIDDEDEAGPSLPPDLEEEDGDDEEGRFFGGGLDENATAAMDYLDAAEGEGEFKEEKYDLAWVKRVSVNFEKKIAKNSDLRARYEDDPSKFMESEADLDDTIKALSILSEHSELYEEFAKLSAERLVNLLAHENVDIAIDAIEIISELTDEDVEAEQEQWDALVTAMLEADLLGLLISNFSRFDEKEESDVNGVYHSLSVIENLLSQPTNTDMIGKEAKLTAWLLGRIQKEERQTTQNKAYAAEILSILIQSSQPNRRRLIEANAVDILLTQLASYRRDDPEKGGEEEESVENSFNCLTSLVDEPTGKTKFVEAEGVELSLLMVRDAQLGKLRALKVLDHACGYAEALPDDETQTNGNSSSKANGKKPVESSTNTAAAVCEMIVEKRGLKPLFSKFVKLKKHDPETTEHILGIFASLLRSLPGNSDPRFRLLAKFLEKDYEKVDRLVTLRREYVARVATFNARAQDRMKGLSQEERDELELVNMSSRLDEGLYCLERIDVILAWLVAEDDGAKKAIVKALAERDESLADVKRTLQAQLNGVLEVEPAERAMLEALMGFLD